MYLAGGAGAPPPPPLRGLTNLPTELLLCIIQYLRTEDYVSLALAIYPTLRRHGLVPPLTNGDCRRLIRYPSLPSPGPVFVWPLPMELIQEIIEFMEPTDVIAFIFSHRELAVRFMAPMSLSTQIRLRLWTLDH